MLVTAGLTLGIHPKDDNQNTSSGTISIGFMIDDIKEAKALLDKNNIQGATEDDGKSGTYIHFKDPDGTVLYFVQPKWE